MREKGLGTPATRSAIIEGLITTVTFTSGPRIDCDRQRFGVDHPLRGIGATELCSRNDGEWESQTQAMQKGAMKRNDFMADIKKFTREIVEKAKNFEGDSVTGRFRTA